MATKKSSIKAKVKAGISKASSQIKALASKLGAGVSKVSSNINKSGGGSSKQVFKVGENMSPSMASKAQQTVSKFMTPLPKSSNAPLSRIPLPFTRKPKDFGFTPLPGGNPQSTPAFGSSRIPRPKSRSSAGASNMAGALAALQGQASTPPSLSEGDFGFTPLPTTSYQGRVGTEEKSYSFPGGQKGVGAGQLSDQQSATIERLNDIGEQKQAVADAVATATTPEEESEYDEEIKKLDREEARLQRELERLTRPSDEEESLRQQDDALLAQESAVQAGLDRSVAAIKDQPVPYGFITGQAQAAENRANADLRTISSQRIPLQQRLAQEQAKRQAALDVAKLKAGTLEKKRSRYSSLADERRKRNEPFELGEGQSRYVYNPKTGKYEVIASRAKTYAPKSSTPKTPKGLSSGSLNFTQADIGQGSTALENSRGSDGYVNSELYINLYRDWVNNGGLLSDFKKYFPPSAYVNPNDPTVPQYLQF